MSDTDSTTFWLTTNFKGFVVFFGEFGFADHFHQKVFFINLTHHVDIKGSFARFAVFFRNF